MFETGGLVKKTLITIKIVALAVAIWVVVFHKPAVTADGANGFFIADTNWLRGIDDIEQAAREHCAAAGLTPTALEERRRLKEGFRNNSRRYYFSCQ